uniref:outer membrane beta-barrel protein n=1 Tax=Acinetobacter baumannii TaxID=470 RepID=UPI001487A455
GGGRTTYSEFTLGLNITPPIPKTVLPIASVTFRPEVRYDRSLNGTSPFNANRVGRPGTSEDQFTFGGDIIVAF